MYIHIPKTFPSFISSCDVYCKGPGSMIRGKGKRPRTWTGYGCLCACLLGMTKLFIATCVTLGRYSTCSPCLQQWLWTELSPAPRQGIYVSEQVGQGPWWIKDPCFTWLRHLILNSYLLHSCKSKTAIYSFFLS